MKNNISLKKRFLSLVTAGVLGFSYVPTFAEGIATPTDLEPIDAVISEPIELDPIKTLEGEIEGTVEPENTPEEIEGIVEPENPLAQQTPDPGLPSRPTHTDGPIYTADPNSGLVTPDPNYNHNIVTTLYTDNEGKFILNKEVKSLFGVYLIGVDFIGTVIPKHIYLNGTNIGSISSDGFIQMEGKICENTLFTVNFMNKAGDTFS